MDTLLSRLADTLVALKLSREAISEQFESARALALASEIQDFAGRHWKVTITDVESAKLDMEKLEKYLKRMGKSTKDFQTTSKCSRLLLKPIA